MKVLVLYIYYASPILGFQRVPTLGVKVPMDSRIFKGRLQGSKLIGLSFLYHWKVLEMQMFKMGLHDTFGYLRHELWLKEGSAVELLI